MQAWMGLLLLAAAPGFAGQPERSLPLFFLPNTGQADHEIRYLGDTPELRAGFAADSATFRMHEAVVRVRFAGANPDVLLAPAEPLAGRANMLLGDDPRRWRTDIPTYRKLIY